MKHFFTLFCSLIISAVCIAQTFSFQENEVWDSPEFDRSFVAQKSIKSIQIRSYQNQDTTPEHFTSSIFYEYDAEGNLVQLVETKEKDTSRVCDYYYTERGMLGWEHTRDKIWNKSYKSGYRFNRNQKVFQVKSYEMLRNNEVMLLNTRQYVYGDDSLLIAIRFLENQRVAKVHTFEYDKVGRVTSEIFNDGHGEELKRVNYAFNAQDKIESVTTIKAGMTRQYVYSYDTDGNPTQVRWLQNNEPRGTVTFTYDEGLLTKIHRVVNKGASEERHYSKVFKYKTFQ